MSGHEDSEVNTGAKTKSITKPLQGAKPKETDKKPENPKKNSFLDDYWCLRENAWTVTMEDALKKTTETEKRHWDLALQCFRCAAQELLKIKWEFVKYAETELKAPFFEESVKDFRECPLKVIHSYNNPGTYYQVYRSHFGISWMMMCYDCQNFRSALSQVVLNGCPYKPELKKHVEVAYSLCLDIVCMVYKWNTSIYKYKEHRPVKFPEYLTKNTSNLFLRDYFIIRDFLEYCNVTLLYSAFLERKFEIILQMIKEHPYD